MNNSATHRQPTLTDEDCYAIFKASQAAWARLETIKNARSFQLELLYLAIKDPFPTDSIMCAIAILDEQKAEQRKQYLALLLAHANAVSALNTSDQPLLQ